jgi:hypothetical protein
MNRPEYNRIQKGIRVEVEDVEGWHPGVVTEVRRTRDGRSVKTVDVALDNGLTDRVDAGQIDFIRKPR